MSSPATAVPAPSALWELYKRKKGTSNEVPFLRLQGCCHDSFDSMHPVFGFIENDGLFTFKDFVGDFHAVNGKLIKNLLADGGFQIVGRWWR